MSYVKSKENSNLGDAYGNITRLFSTVTNGTTVEAIKYIATLVGSSKEKMDIEEHLLGYKDGNGRNVCHFVCSAKRNDTLKAIIKLAPGIVNSLDNSNENPLFLSVRAQDIESVTTLLESGVEITRKNSSGCNVLHYACQAADLNLVKLIISNLESKNLSEIDSFVNTCSDEFGTPLQWACMTNNKELISYLLNHKANPNKAPLNRLIPSPLMITVGIGNTELTELLLKSGAHLGQAMDSEGYTPIFGAVEKNDVELLSLIIEYMKLQSCDVSNQIVKGNSIYSYAVSNRCSEEIMEILKSHALDSIKIDNVQQIERGPSIQTESIESIESNEYSLSSDEKKSSDFEVSPEIIIEQDLEDASNYDEGEAERLKTEANSLFKEGKFDKSIVTYSNALNHLKIKKSKLSEKAIALKSSILSNRCLSHIKIGDSSKALFDATSCIYINPKWSKGYYRCSQVYHMMGDVANQACYIWDAITNENSNSSLKQEYLDAFSQIMKKHRQNQY
ncbi:ankyrin repeat containing TPR domain-containing [Cryptosporidium sp. chipmunk genotype I]|uniref:ankyrin repeat containing TPR domain-containing n=1 Tax=Cryptosporidium sp. chipmunk genotype I TaxID=1280935 RepID=UPI003519F060|nr:ankyrin repeat containing TPR domain-containing [Cryptosporidium sp. chipmunk genotype I]